ncbi:MAG: 23S rRNA (guanosine(2251)-2'-O)-methyltransferase RlmB [Actinomycetales bacterium]|jgi:23S rRNA (guanosine2251-2'-O)-methyltransferase|nr:23S rRNA (guanosine(2251)-2'-O)-methyltransferase RlmB [Actinomycetales bacterium]HMT32999.1 23S rRNA (guanosine(2251)-2'-O)-methyltransferase RlmB [Dermatophilaceae bacterium]
MAGNSQRRGAVRKSGKGATVGSGGQRRKGLEGRGPTPKAVDREHHPAHKRATSAARGVAKAGAPAGRSGGSTSGGSSGQRSAGASRYAGAKGSGGRAGGSGRPGRSAKPSSEMVAGRNSVVEALRADIPATTMYIATRIDSDDRVREALKEATQRGIPVLECPRGELDRLTDGAVHQGLALQVPAYEYADPADFVDPEAPGVPLVVAMDGITDPRNLGAIIRSVAAFGGHGVVVPERRSVGMTASAWKTSAGAAARVPVAKASNLTRALEAYQKAGFFVVGLDMDGDVDLPELDLATEPLVIVVGSEGKGLSRLVRETCDRIVSIPMVSSVESLNAGIATGVALYEVARARRIASRGR